MLPVRPSAVGPIDLFALPDSNSMGLSISLEKIEEARAYVLYAFGGPDASVGRVRLYKSTGDLELVSLSPTEEDPDERYYLAHAVPRLQSYHDRATYPDADQWEA